MCQYRRLSGVECCGLSNGSDRNPLKGSPPPPFIDTKRDGVHVQGIVEVVVFPPNRGGAVVEHCGKYTVGMASGVAVILGIVLGLAEITPASYQSQQAAWSSL